jgi:hypothetical protein
MATSDNPFVPSPETDINSPEVHRHDVPIVNIEEEEWETLEYESPEKVEEDDHGEPPHPRLGLNGA